MRHRELWYKNAIIYSVDVETFADSNDDGIGDFGGLISRLDYLESLGVTCIWLMPFFPTPNRDNGYDVLDYYSVDPRLGDLGQFVEFTYQANQRGIRVLIDLVINHTSIDHPWFQMARQDEHSPYRDYYLWSEEKPEDAEEGVVFPGVQESTWTYDEQAGAYYMHRFYKHQPDLNINNPHVIEEIRKIIGFWLQLGVAGFRMDAAPFVIEMRGEILVPGIKDKYEYLETFRHFLQWRRGDAIMLAEANIAPDKVDNYFGDGDKLHMLFNFFANQFLFLSLAEERATPLIDSLQSLPSIPKIGQWGSFLRNHDELDLGRLSDEQRKLAFEKFAPEKTMQLYDRGIRRRLAPMLNQDRRRMELAYSLMFSLPGTPILYYGEEIGMGDDLSLDERNSVRTPMQWSTDKNGGFSRADAEDLIRPVIDEGEFGYQHVNVAAQRQSRDSFLNWMKNLLHTRRECPEFGFGEWELMDTGDERVLAHRCTWDSGAVIAVHNFSGESLTVSFNGEPDHDACWIDLLGGHADRRIDRGEKRIDLEGYGYRWFRVDQNGGHLF